MNSYEIGSNDWGAATKSGVRGPVPAWWTRQFSGTDPQFRWRPAMRCWNVTGAILLAAALAAAQTRVDLKTQAKSVDFSAATATKPSKTGTALPATCAPGETFVKTDAPEGSNLYICTATNHWAAQGGTPAVSTVFGRTGAVTAQPGDYSFSQISGTVANSQLAAGVDAVKIGAGTVNNTVLGYLSNVNFDIQTQFNGKAANSHSHVTGGDASGSIGALTVTALRNRRIGTAAPGEGQALIWNSITSQWEPQTVSGAGGSYTSSFTSATTVAITGAAHQLGTSSVLVDCYDGGVPGMRVWPNTITVHPTTYDVTVTFLAAQTGRCVVTAGGGRGGSGASMGVQLGDLNVVRTSATGLTIGTNCSTATPCNVRLGSRVYSFLNASDVTLTAGTGTAYIYVDANGLLTVGHNVSLTCTSPCTTAAGVSSFPVNSIPLYTWPATAGNWDISGGSDKRSFLNGKVVSGGMGITTVDSDSNTTISLDTALVPMYLAGAATLDFGAIPTGSCASDLTFSLPGAAIGDAVSPGWPSAMAAGLIGTMRVSAANSIAVRVCNLSGTPVDPASASYQATIVRSF
jgi:hypothetical protein